MDIAQVGSAPRRRIVGCLVSLGLLAVAAVPLRAQQGEPLRVGGDVSAPRKISGDPPSYTEVARRARATGVVIIEAVIDEHGAVTDTRVLKPLPFGLDAKAIEAVRTWKFVPAMFQGKPVSVYYILSVNFQLQSDFNFGPAFSAFLGAHPDVRKLMDERDYDGASQLLDGWAAQRPGDNALRMMRAYVHLGAGEVKEAWHVAQSVSGPEEGEVTAAIGDKALELAGADREVPTEQRSATLDVGLAAAGRAVEVAGDDAERAAASLRTKAALLRAQAELTTEATRRKALLDQAKAADARADELRPPGQMLH